MSMPNKNHTNKCIELILCYKNIFFLKILFKMNIKAGASELSPQNELQFIKSQKGKPVLLYSGHRYNLKVCNKNGSTNWRCANRDSCSSSITLNPEKTAVLSENTHSCRTNFAKNQIDFVMDICKKKVTTKYTPMQQIFEKEFSNPKHNVTVMADFASKKDTLSRARRRALAVAKTDFKSLNEVEVPKLLAHNFLQCDDGNENNKILLFATPEAKRFLKYHSDAVQFFGDGTFDVPSPFSQLFTVHADIDSSDEVTNIVPILYALLPDKNKKTYERLFNIIKRDINVEIHKFKCDYEVGLINAFKTIFPQSQVTGCHYHYSKAVWRKAKQLDLTRSGTCVNIVRLCANLPLLPAEFMKQTWDVIKEEIVMSTKHAKKLQTFVVYFEKQWMSMCLETLSCANERHRTNNGLEGWNRRFNSRIKVTPTLTYFIHALRQEAKWQNFKIRRILFKSEPRRKNQMLFERKYKRELKNLLDQIIEPIVFLRRISHIRKLLFGDY